MEKFKYIIYKRLITDWVQWRLGAPDWVHVDWVRQLGAYRLGARRLGAYQLGAVTTGCTEKLYLKKSNSQNFKLF